MIFIGSISLFSCAPKVAEEVVEESSAMSTEAAQGKAIFIKKCSQCHDLPVVDAYSRDKWDKVLPPMADNAKLTEAENALVEAYVNWELEN